MTLEELVGQRLVIGIEGKRVTPETLEIFRATRAGGLILFERNFESPDQVRKLIQDLEQALGKRLLILVDHEGGRVIRFKEGVTVFPDAQCVGASGWMEGARRQGEIEAEELLRLGVDVNLAPVLDVLTSNWNPAIGTRSYGKDPELVGEMGKARIEGMQSKGLSACAKHYPGLGSLEKDPHFELPVVSKSWKAVKQIDLLPFLKAFEAQVHCVMSSHVVYPDMESKRPATFSRKIIHDHLRLEWGYSGLILTDDLKMQAISKRVSLREAAPLAADAGHDLLLICSDPRAQQEAFDALIWAYKKRELKSSQLEESAERILRLTQKRKERFLKQSPVSKQTGREWAREITRKGAEILSDGKGLLPLSPAGCLKHSLLALFPDLSPIQKERFVEPELLESASFLQKNFSQFGVSFKSIEFVSLNPDEDENERIQFLVRSHDLVLFFCWDAHLFTATRELLRMLQQIGSRLIVILLREPQDLDWIQPQTACVTAFGYRLCQVEAAIEKLFSTA